MRIYNKALKLHIMLTKNVLNSRQLLACVQTSPISFVAGNCRNILEFWRKPEVIGHYKKITPFYLRKNLLATAGNLKVNGQTNYKSVPFLFLFLDIERKSEIWNIEFLSLIGLWNFYSAKFFII